jgi:hypothetical protein
LFCSSHPVVSSIRLAAIINGNLNSTFWSVPRAVSIPLIVPVPPHAFKCPPMIDSISITCVWGRSMKRRQPHPPVEGPSNAVPRGRCSKCNVIWGIIGLICTTWTLKDGNGPWFESWPELPHTVDNHNDNDNDNDNDAANANASSALALPMQMLAEIHNKTKFNPLWKPGQTRKNQAFKSPADVVALQRHFVAHGICRGGTG